MAEDKVDRAGKDSFPASDAPANSGIVGPRVQKPAPGECDEEMRPKGTPIETAYQRQHAERPRRT